jgi:hypothetical protein
MQSDVCDGTCTLMDQLRWPCHNVKLQSETGVRHGHVGSVPLIGPPSPGPAPLPGLSCSGAKRPTETSYTTCRASECNMVAGHALIKCYTLYNSATLYLVHTARSIASLHPFKLLPPTSQFRTQPGQGLNAVQPCSCTVDFGCNRSCGMTQACFGVSSMWSGACQAASRPRQQVERMC